MNCCDFHKLPHGCNQGRDCPLRKRPEHEEEQYLRPWWLVWAAIAVGLLWGAMPTASEWITHSVLTH